MASLPVGLGVHHDYREGAARLGVIPEAVQRHLGSFAETAAALMKEKVAAEMPHSDKPGAHASDDVASEVVRIPGGVRARAYTDTDIPYYLEKGTRPHEIRPKHGKALAFSWLGRDWVLAKVNHPGTKAYLYYEQAGIVVAPLIERHFNGEMREALGGAN